MFFQMKKHPFLSAALFGGLALVATSCDKGGDDGNKKIDAGRFAGITTMSVTGMPMTFQVADTMSVDIAADDTVRISFAARTVSVPQMGNVQFTIGKFTIDSVLVAKTSNGYTLSRANKFSVSSTMKTGGGTADVPTTVSGSLGNSSVADNKANVVLENVAAGNMPVKLTFSFEGTKTQN